MKRNERLSPRMQARENAVEYLRRMERQRLETSEADSDNDGSSLAYWVIGCVIAALVTGLAFFFYTQIGNLGQ